MTAAARDFERERGHTTRAGLAAGVSIDALLKLAEDRAGDAPVRDAATRDFALEVREELADARNYLAWWDAQIPAGSPAHKFIDAAMAAVAEAFVATGRAETTAGGPPRAALARAIADTAAAFAACRCDLHAWMTDEDLVALEGGCTSPRWCCPRLATVRRRVIG